MQHPDKKKIIRLHRRQSFLLHKCNFKSFILGDFATFSAKKVPVLWTLCTIPCWQIITRPRLSAWKPWSFAAALTTMSTWRVSWHQLHWYIFQVPCSPAGGTHAWAEWNHVLSGPCCMPPRNQGQGSSERMLWLPPLYPATIGCLQTRWRIWKSWEGSRYKPVLCGIPCLSLVHMSTGIQAAWQQASHECGEPSVALSLPSVIGCLCSKTVVPGMAEKDAAQSPQLQLLANSNLPLPLCGILCHDWGACPMTSACQRRALHAHDCFGSAAIATSGLYGCMPNWRTWLSLPLHLLEGLWIGQPVLDWRRWLLSNHDGTPRRKLGEPRANSIQIWAHQPKVHAHKRGWPLLRPCFLDARARI